MREMAIFGVPCWGLMVSEGVPGSNDRAERANCPNRGHAIPNTGKIYAAPRVALFGSWNWKLCFWFIWWWAVLKCSYCGSVFGEPLKSKSEFGVEAVKKLDSDQHHWFDTTLNFDEEKRNQWQGQICQKGLRGAIEVSQVVTQLSTDMKTTGQPNPSFFSSRVFKDSWKMLLFPGDL